MLSLLKRWFAPRNPAPRRDSRPPNAAPAAPEAWERLAEQPLSVDAQLAVANQQMTEQILRERIRSNVRRVREANSDNPSSLWALSFVDPYDWAMDTPDFYPGIGLGGGWGVPWLLNNQGRGDLLPVYINEMGLKIIRDWSRRICAFNEFALNALENRVSYIVGKGFQYSVVPKRKPTTPAQSLGDEEGNEPSRLASMAQAVLDEFVSRERWNEREQECVRRCERDGEAFLRFFHTGDGLTSVRFVEPEFVTEGQAFQAGNSTVQSTDYRQYGVNTEPGDVEDVQSYSIVENPLGGWVTQEVEAKEVLHIKVNVDSNNKRGLPTLFPVRKNLERADKLLRNMSVLAQIQSTFAVIRKHKQFGPSSVSAYQQAGTDQNVSVPASGRNLSVRQLYPGSIIDTSEKTEYEFPHSTVDASALVAILQAELRAIAARLVMPEFMLTVDASNANFASTMVAESPWVKKGERDQSFFARNFGDGEYGRSRSVGAMWRVLENAVEGGLLPREVLTACEIQAEGPTLVVRDKVKETERAAKLADAGVLSEETWSKWEGLDRQQELQLGAKRKEKPAPTFPGLGGETPKPAPPGSAGGMSEAVLREDEGRWVTIGGRKSDDGKRRGGSPVYIKDGKIVKGAPSLTGRNVSNMKDKPADVSRRKEVNQAKDYEKATYAKKAKKEGIKPEHLHQLAGEIAAHDKAHVEQRKRLLKDAREMLTKYGYNAKSLTTNLGKGYVEDNIPHMDLVARSMAYRFPDQFAGYENDDVQRMTDLLTAGNPEAMSQEDAYEQALNHLRDMKANEPEEDEEDDFPFGANEKGDGDKPAEDEDDFPFGANEKPAPKQEQPRPAPSRSEARVNAAKARYENRGQTAKGGGLFGGEDMQAREGFRKLPDGAGVLFVGGDFEGKTGKIVHDYDPSTGQPRIVAEVEGRPGLVPITPDAIEPLDAHLSWRTDTAYGQQKQGGLFTADQLLKPRS